MSLLAAIACEPTAVGEQDAAAAAAEQHEAEASLFTEITEQSGLPAAGKPWRDGVYFLPEIMQGGVALVDYDNDADLDIVHALIPPPGSPDEPAPNRLYQRQPDGRYVDVTERAGLGDPGFGQGVAIGDVDNDGDRDVYFTNYGPDAFYRNNGDGTFTDATSAAGFEGNRWSVSATFCDYDRDGFLDLYVVHYVKYDAEVYCQDESGRQEYCGPQVFHGEPDRLYRNNGDGTFTDVTDGAGIVLPRGGRRARGLGVVCTDLTGDGRVDFYVANDAESNQLWVNRGDGTFVDQGVARGVAVNRHGKPEASMGLAVGDVNGDEALDLFMTHLVQEHNTLYLGDPGGVLFFDRTLESRLALGDAEFTGFGCGFLDLDNDGDLDLAVANGRVRRGRRFVGARLGPFWNDYAEPNFLYRNNGRGVFENLDARAGRFTSTVEVSRGLAFGDLDDDGDLDMVLTNADNTIRVYRNDAPPPGAHWLRVRAMTGGRDALGARVTVEARGERRLGLALDGYSYAGGNDPRVHFGLGDADRVDSVEVQWPDGQREQFEVDGVDRELTVVRGTGAPL